jgi:hypothetical protein
MKNKQAAYMQPCTVHSVHAVKPSLEEAQKKPARAFMQPRGPIYAAWQAHINLSMDNKVAAYM